VFAGKADPGNGPVSVSTYPNYVSSAEKGWGPYPYSVSTATSLLKSHGWDVNPNGVTTCTSPGTGPSDCGAGIAAGQKLAFTMLYGSGQAMTDQMMAAIVTWEQQAGIKMTLKAEPFNTLEATVGLCNGQSHPASTCGWQLVNFGYLSSGLEPNGVGVFNTDGYINQGGYSNPEMDSLTNASEYSNSSSIIEQWENYSAQQLPVFYLPLNTVAWAYPSSLGGFDKINPLNAGQDSQNWYYTK
jgi:peptide/nickel transport system substrate-binding protein